MNKKLQSSHLIIFAVIGFFLTLILIPLSDLLFSEKSAYCKNLKIDVSKICKTKSNLFFPYDNGKNNRILFHILNELKGMEILPNSKKITVFLKHNNKKSLILVQKIFKKKEWLVCNLEELELEDIEVC